MNDSEDAARAAAHALDRHWLAALAKSNAGLSPVSLGLAFADWSLNLATQPAQALRLATRAWRDAGQAWAAALAGRAPDGDARFAAPDWQRWPWSLLAQGQLAAQAWWRDAAQVDGMTRHHAEMTGFFARQWLDGLSPSNLPLLNPEVQRRTAERGGANLVEGAGQAVDRWRAAHGLLARPPAYRPGVEVALTPGRVVHRNALVELLQYAPSTATVQREPVLIVPSWIMKYYILDLSPHNSLVRWLVSQGHTVFMLSWRNPDEGDALLGMDDYLEAGVFDVLDAIARLVPGERVHACGYCLGGTLLALGAAALARDGDARLASVTLLAAETDFSEPGELGILIDEAQVEMLEAMMAERGFLTGRQMAGSFTFLHARELLWAEQMRTLWLGEPSHPNDLMSWNADVTRMPAVMHSEYLRRCYLKNEIAEGRFPVRGRPVSLADITAPMFVVGTETDHVSPWKSVHKVHRLCQAEISFVLTSGGHNAGIVSEPGHPHRRFVMGVRAHDGPEPTPEAWRAQATAHDGSWWPAWHDWLVARGSGTVPAREPADAGLGAAPGENVHRRFDD